MSVFATATFVILQRNRLGPAVVGLVISQSFGFPQLLSSVADFFANTDALMSAVERVFLYTGMPTGGGGGCYTVFLDCDQTNNCLSRNNTRSAPFFLPIPIL